MINFVSVFVLIGGTFLLSNTNIGGTSGIGEGIARYLAIEEGANVVFCGRRVEKGQTVEQEINSSCKEKEGEGGGGGEACFVQADVLTLADIERVFQEAETKYGGVDIVIPNAGFEGNPTSKVMTEGFMENYRLVMDINLESLIHTCRVGVPYLENRGTTAGGYCFVNSSLFSVIGAPGWAAYAMSKGACDALVRCLAVELAEQNIKVYSFNPYTIDSELSRRVLGMSGISIEDWAAQHNPSGKVGTGQQIGKLLADIVRGKYVDEYPSGSNLLTDGNVLFHAQEATKLARIWGTPEFKDLVTKHTI